MPDPSFDVVSEVDHNEVRNAVTQARKEIATRFDFKGSASSVAQDGDDALVLASDDEGKLRQVVDVLESKLVRRKVDLGHLDYGTVEPAAGGTVRQHVTLAAGIPAETAREITKLVKQRFKKVQAQIQGDEVRITGKNRDDLQAVIAELRAGDYGRPLQFKNFRG